MINLMERLLIKYQFVLAYLFFGVCATILNIVIYYGCANIMNLSTAISTVVAWFFAVVFAFATNKSWVFRSKSWNKNTVVREFFSFLLCRIATGILDLLVMIVTVDYLFWSGLVMKMISNVMVIILNYVASKSIIFRK